MQRRRFAEAERDDAAADEVRRHDDRRDHVGERRREVTVREHERGERRIGAEDRVHGRERPGSQRHDEPAYRFDDVAPHDDQTRELRIHQVRDADDEWKRQMRRGPEVRGNLQDGE